jgi:hypothetical protein
MKAEPNVDENMDMKAVSNENMSSSTEDILSTLFPPREYNCKEINSIDIGYRLDFVRGPFKYIIHLPGKEEPEFKWGSLDKISTVLPLGELAGSEDGIYTWLLCDFGDIRTMQIFVKPTINISEIGTKHSNILKDICSNKHIASQSSQSSQLSQLPTPKIIRVYFGGELSKTTDRNTEHTEHITYKLNFLSGTYSEGVINPLDVPPEVETEIERIFRLGVCEGVCLPNISVEISKTTDTFITTGNEPVEDFDYKMMDIYGRYGAKIYKFKWPEEKDDADRMNPLDEISLKVSIEQLDRTRAALEKYGTIFSDYDNRLQALKEKYRQLTPEQKEAHLLHSDMYVEGGWEKIKEN